MKRDRELIVEAIALLNKDDYQGAARVLESHEKFRISADNCRDIRLSWQQGGVVCALESELQNLSRSTETEHDVR